MANSKDNGVAVGKRIRINKMQQHIILSVLGASVVMGACVVLSVFFVKYIIFNSRVIGEKSASLENYEKSYNNIASLKDTINNNVAYNKDLESVARGNISECYDGEGGLIDYASKYQQAVSDNNKEQMEINLLWMKTCSALRVIPDALPAAENREALMASLNKIFNISGIEPEELSPDADGAEFEVDDDLLRIPVTLRAKGDNASIIRLLQDLEKSIRVFDLNTAMISWTGDDLELNASAAAFYTVNKGTNEYQKTLYADPKKEAEQEGLIDSNNGGV